MGGTLLKRSRATPPFRLRARRNLYYCQRRTNCDGDSRVQGERELVKDCRLPAIHELGVASRLPMVVLVRRAIQEALYGCALSVVRSGAQP
jgi:hypothetical protein